MCDSNYGVNWCFLGRSSEIIQQGETDVPSSFQNEEQQKLSLKLIQGRTKPVWCTIPSKRMLIRSHDSDTFSKCGGQV
jgi:hypothetical protein